MVVENQYGCIMADGMGLGKVRGHFSEEMHSLNAPHPDSPMHRPHVDSPQAISACPKADDREVHHRVSLEFGQELGQRAWCVQLLGLHLSVAVTHSVVVKWLGPDAISALAIDGKGGKAEMLEKVARWVAASGRNVSQPGDYIPLRPFLLVIDLGMQ